MKWEYLDYLEDMLDEIKRIGEFVNGLDYKEFFVDTKTVYAVIRSLEIIGEASKKIPRPVKSRHKDIPWKEMSGMRDKLIHEYFGVDLAIVWLVATEELPPLIDKVMLAIKEEKTSPTA
ncbi:MAG: DUF86 domain-containing protein [Nitrospirae bacterium]|nr:DUF86 domain-containing protein [Nitrospirota bacterium]